MVYDQFSSDYDRFVNWNSRLAFEMPLLEKWLAPLKLDQRPVQVLDAACGTGMHALELARRGYSVRGADLSAGMIEVARRNAAAAGMAAQFEAVGFGELAAKFGKASSDAVICLGNSLPHALTPADQLRALIDFSDCLLTGGRLIIQNRNFDKVLAARERWMEPQAYQEGSDEWLFLRFYDYLPDGLIDFNIVTLRRSGDGWKQCLTTTRLYPLRQAELSYLLDKAGFEIVQTVGSMNGSPFEAAASDNLIICADKK